MSLSKDDVESIVRRQLTRTVVIVISAIALVAIIYAAWSYVRLVEVTHRRIRAWDDYQQRTADYMRRVSPPHYHSSNYEEEVRKALMGIDQAPIAPDDPLKGSLRDLAPEERSDPR